MPSGVNQAVLASHPSAAPQPRPQASDTDYLYLAGRTMVVPGVYTLLVLAKTGTPRVELQVGLEQCPAAFQLACQWRL